MQIMFDVVVGVMLPTRATIILKTKDDNQVKGLQKSLNQIFFNGNSSRIALDSIKKSKEWHKTTFKVDEPLKFRSNFTEFKKQHKELVVFEDLERRKITSYVPYTGFLGMLINIAYFRDLLLEYADQLIMACYDLIRIG